MINGIKISEPFGGRSSLRSPAFLIIKSIIGSQNGIQMTSFRESREKLFGKYGLMIQRFAKYETKQKRKSGSLRYRNCIINQWPLGMCSKVMIVVVHRVPAIVAPRLSTRRMIPFAFKLGTLTVRRLKSPANPPHIMELAIMPPHN